MITLAERTRTRSTSMLLVAFLVLMVPPICRAAVTPENIANLDRTMSTIGIKIDRKIIGNTLTETVTLNGRVLAANLALVRQLLFPPNLPLKTMQDKFLTVTEAAALMVMGLSIRGEYEAYPIDQSKHIAKIVMDDGSGPIEVDIFTFGFDRHVFKSIDWPNFTPMSLPVMAPDFELGPVFASSLHAE